MDSRNIAPEGHHVADTSDIIALAKQYKIIYQQYDTVYNVYLTRLGDFFCYKLENDGFFNETNTVGTWDWNTNRYKIGINHYDLFSYSCVFWLHSASSPANVVTHSKQWIGHQRIYSFQKTDYSHLSPNILINAYPIRCLKN